MILKIDVNFLGLRLKTAVTCSIIKNQLNEKTCVRSINEKYFSAGGKFGFKQKSQRWGKYFDTL